MANKKKQKRHTTKLNQHKRQKKTLVPPLMTMNPTLVQWNRDILPEMLLLDAILNFDESASANIFHQIMDILDEHNKSSEKIVTGMISSLNLISDSDQLIESLEELGLYDCLVPEGLKHGLSLYSDLPSEWLIQKWKSNNHVDWELGTSYLKDAVKRLYDFRDVQATKTQMLVLSRFFKHGKIKIARRVFEEGTMQLFPKYPDNLNEDEQKQVESSSRSMFNGIIGISELRNSAWTQSFWRTNYNISPCIKQEGNAQFPLTTYDEVANLHKDLADISQKLTSLIELCISHCVVDVFEQHKSEVVFGITSRQLYIFNQISLNTDSWVTVNGMMWLRSMVDALINVKWMSMQQDTNVYLNFKKYSLGNVKLHKLKLEDMIDNGMVHLEPLAEELQSLIDEESLEEFVNIDLGNNFDGPNIREKAIEADLKDMYDLVYSPASSELHGEWVTLKQNHLMNCLNPLHRFHRLPKLSQPKLISVAPVQLASQILRTTLIVCMETLDCKYANLQSDLAKFCEDVNEVVNKWQVR